MRVDNRKYAEMIRHDLPPEQLRETLVRNNDTAEVKKQHDDFRKKIDELYLRSKIKK